jgi:hypothetical protein
MNGRRSAKTQRTHRKSGTHGARRRRPRYRAFPGNLTAGRRLLGVHVDAVPDKWADTSRLMRRNRPAVVHTSRAFRAIVRIADHTASEHRFVFDCFASTGLNTPRDSVSNLLVSGNAGVKQQVLCWLQ